MEASGIQAKTVDTLRAVSERNRAERRLSAIVAAIERHETAQLTKPYARRAEDFGLYRRVREILAEA